MNQPPPPPPPRQRTRPAPGVPADHAKQFAKLHGAAESAVVFGWMLAVLGTLAGAAVIMAAAGSDSFDNATAGVVVGVAIIGVSLLVGAVVILLGHWAKAWAHVNEP